MYYIYILKSINYKKSYVGKTTDIVRRLHEHNTGKSIYTSRYKPWELIYKEVFKTEKEAINKEKYYKSKKGRKEMKKIFDKLSGVI